MTQGMEAQHVHANSLVAIFFALTFVHALSCSATLIFQPEILSCHTHAIAEMIRLVE
jgi:hypothetical protein